MDFSYPPVVEQVRKELRAWLAANLTEDIVAAGRRRAKDDATFEKLRTWNAAMADAGWAAVSWPQEYGGRGATVLEQLVYAEETTRARVPMPLNVIGMNNIAPAIMQYGTDAQKHTLLPRMMRADDIWCQGMSEPEAGSDLASLPTRVVRDGDDFVANGQKIWTSLGRVLEELGAGLHPGPWLSSAVAATRALTRFGVDSVTAATLFSGIAGGSTIATVGPPGGARPIAIEQGDGSVLRGTIDNIWDVAVADVLLVLADEQHGRSLFAVQMPTARVEVTPQTGIDQTRKQFRVEFGDTPARRLATATPDAIAALVDDVVIAWAADPLGAARAVLQLAVEYAEVRQQFGQPIGAFQAVQHLCVDANIRSRRCRGASATIRGCKPPGTPRA